MFGSLVTDCFGYNSSFQIFPVYDSDDAEGYCIGAYYEKSPA